MSHALISVRVRVLKDPAARAVRPQGDCSSSWPGRACQDPADPPGQGWAAQVHSIKPKLKPPETELLTLKYREPLSTFAFNFILRRYTKRNVNPDINTVQFAKNLPGMSGADIANICNEVGCCRLPVSKPVLKVPMVSALKPSLRVTRDAEGPHVNGRERSTWLDFLAHFAPILNANVHGPCLVNGQSIILTRP